MYTFDAVKAKNECVNWIRDWFEKNGKDCNAVIGISGGKDSTIVAALCKEALGAERVIGVMLPDDVQFDINDSREIIRHLGIKSLEFNIGNTVNDMKDAYETAVIQANELLGYDHPLKYGPSRQSKENLPPRIRMSALYMIAQSCNGRVSNNCNLSENWIGYSTIYGDTAGDFSPISNFTVSEVIEIGRVLEIPERFLTKAPSDGLCGKTDEEKIGFPYAVLDEYIRTGVITNLAIKAIIDRMHAQNKFKHELMAAFTCSQFNAVNW